MIVRFTNEGRSGAKVKHSPLKRFFNLIVNVGIMPLAGYTVFAIADYNPHDSDPFFNKMKIVTLLVATALFVLLMNGSDKESGENQDGYDGQYDLDQVSDKDHYQQVA